MEKDMLARIQQMITTATESLRLEVTGMKTGQQFLGQRIENVQADMDSKNRETRAFLELSYRQVNERLERLEQRRDI